MRISVILSAKENKRLMAHLKKHGGKKGSFLRALMLEKLDQAEAMDKEQKAGAA